MTETYFSKFPVITYQNYQARNITERVSIVTKSKIGSMVYYPYELGNELRADQLADSYYNDSSLDWMIWLSNDIVDPYYGWHIYDLDFFEYIDDKYGSLDNAEQKIAFFRTNWPSDEHVITPKYYDDLDGAFKKYYQPKWGHKRTILGYERRQDDMSVNTNKIVQYSITMVNGAFSNGELLILNYPVDDSGRAECMTANDTILIAKNHVDKTEPTEPDDVFISPNFVAPETWTTHNAMVSGSGTLTFTEDGNISGHDLAQTVTLPAGSYRLSAEFKGTGPTPRGFLLFGYNDSISSGAEIAVNPNGSFAPIAGSPLIDVWGSGFSIQSATVTPLGDSFYSTTLYFTTSVILEGIGMNLLSGTAWQYQGLNNGSGIQFRNVGLYRANLIGVIKSRSNTSIQAVINSVETLVENIPNIEEAYWEPVSMFDVEREKNENRRFLDLLADNYVFPTAEIIRKELLPTRG